MLIMKIICPNNNQNERKYIIEYVFESLLHIPVSVVFLDGESNYTILVGEEKRIVIEDHFFCFYPLDSSYLDVHNIPDKVSWLHYNGTVVPIIYGRDYIRESVNEILIGVDIFASSFFMVTRWEEYLLGREEKYDERSLFQIDENKLFCVRNGIEKRQIVFEYETILRSVLNDLGIHLPFSRTPRVIITHDVDSLGSRPARIILSNTLRFLRNKNWRETKNWITTNIKIFFNSINAMHFFQKYIDIAKPSGYSNIFLVKSCYSSEVECTYDISKKHIRVFLQRLLKKTSGIGFHPSQSVFGNTEQFIDEYNRFIALMQKQPLLGRNHRLLHNTETFYQWSSSPTRLISNWGYQTRVGFRCGISYPVPIFDVFKREKMDVIDLPFTLMDSSLIRECKNEESIVNAIKQVISSSVKHGSVLCINWHIRPFTKHDSNIVYRLFSYIIDELRSNGFDNGSMTSILDLLSKKQIAN